MMLKHTKEKLTVNWQAMLKQMKLKHIEDKAPSFFSVSGGYKMKVKPYNDNSANGLTRCIYDFITFSGGYVNRISTTGTMRKIYGEMKWTKGNSNKGAFDLRFVYQGISGDIEIKIGRDKMSQAQTNEMEKIKRAGGYAFVARSFTEFLEWWNNTIHILKT